MIAIELLAFGVILAAFGLWVAGMYIAALMRGISWRKRDQLSQSLQPQIRDALVDYLAGSDDLTKIRHFVKLSRRDVGDVLLSFQATVGGGARDRLCELALDQALVHDWCQDGRSRDVIARRMAFERLSFVSSYEPCRRVAGDMLRNALDDEDSEVRFSAALAVLQAGGDDDVERVFDVSLSHNLVVRILLAEELRRHIALLCQNAIPEVLASEDYDALLATLDMLLAWERALPLQDMSAIAHHPNRDIRLRALKLAPLLPLTKDTQTAVLDALADPDREIAMAACTSAGRLRIEGSITGLARCLRSGSPDLARAAAGALAAIPPRGWTTLEEMAASDNRLAAASAGEALVRVRERSGPP